jgi:hypothetical protein
MWRAPLSLGISNLYHPAGDRGVGLTVGNGFLNVGAHALGDLVREFLLRETDSESAQIRARQALDRGGPIGVTLFRPETPAKAVAPTASSPGKIPFLGAFTGKLVLPMLPVAFGKVCWRIFSDTREISCLQHLRADFFHLHADFDALRSQHLTVPIWAMRLIECRNGIAAYHALRFFRERVKVC